MPCEMCGKEGARLLRTRIEGTVLRVCEDCARFGAVLDAPGKIKGEAAPSPGTRPMPSRPRERDVLAELVDSLVEDYGHRIRHARESRGWSQEELGKAIAERVSVIKELEAQKMAPPDTLVRKLERTLDIKLMEKVEPVTLAKRGAAAPTTLGDMVKRGGSSS